MNKLKQAMISAIHGLPWKEAIKKEHRTHFVTLDMVRGDKGYFENGKYWECYPITLSRVLQALHQEGWEAHDRSDSRELTNNKISITLYHRHEDYDMGGYNFILEWKLLKEDKSTATLEDQSEETIIELTKIFI